MGLIYVNPEGPNGKPDPVAAAKDIREPAQLKATLEKVEGGPLGQPPLTLLGSRRSSGAGELRWAPTI